MTVDEVRESLEDVPGYYECIISLEDMKLDSVEVDHEREQVDFKY